MGAASVAGPAASRRHEFNLGPLPPRDVTGRHPARLHAYLEDISVDYAVLRPSFFFGEAQ